ncbi:class F sortase [Dictyobacter vulcani]|uniref:Class F sortase n=1 Tax=Dictyobacter vulcani TaxID=2607529 RepID=A0A5J4KEM8_9CHLR|nr:class F sortase [Dictyobacter vulcani]GER87734.1 class F sortase [Dictyobacter vulcani]
MHTRQRYWFLLAFLFVMLSIGLGIWAWSSILSVQHTVEQHTVKKVVPSPHPAVSPTPKGISMSAGAHLIIPAIGINAPVELVGKNADGLMEVPTRNRWEGAGWYKDGPSPGQTGSAVIDGHLDRPGGAPAVFWRLRELHIGDIVTVKEKTGRTVRFKVTKVASYKHDEAPVEQIFGQKNGNFLNLITCAGVWIPAEHQTTERLVVYTKQLTP